MTATKQGAAGGGRPVDRPLRAAFCSNVRFDGACRRLCIRSNCKEPAQDAAHWTCERHTAIDGALSSERASDWLEEILDEPKGGAR